MTPIARLHDFAGRLPAAVRRDLDAVSRSRSLRSGTKLLRVGARPGEIYEIQEGRVKYSAIDHRGRETVLTYMTRGDWVGLSEAFNELPSMWNVVAQSPLEVRVVRHADLHALIDTHPALARQLLRLFARRFSLHRLFGLDHSTLTLKERLVKMLYFLSFGHDKDSADDAPVVLKLSQEELGRAVGASRQKLNPLLKALEREQLLSVRFGALVLHGRARLVQRYGYLLAQGL